MGSHTIPYTLEAHASEHEDTGDDEVNVAALSGELADNQPPKPHEATHVSGGADDIDSALAIAAMAGLATGKFWIGDAGGRPFPIDFPAAGAVLTVAETEVYSGAPPSPSAWTNLDLSGVVGANYALVLIKFKPSASAKQIAFRKNGDTDEYYGWAGSGAGCALAEMYTNIHGIFLVPTDDAGYIEWKYEYTIGTVTIDVIAFLK